MGRVGVRVPSLVGLALEQAHDVALDAGVLAVEVDSRCGGTRAARWVRDQRPRPGRRVVAGAHVDIWVSDADEGDDPGGGGGGGGGDRAPVGPRPVVSSGHKS